MNEYRQFYQDGEYKYYSEINFNKPYIFYIVEEMVDLGLLDSIYLLEEEPAKPLFGGKIKKNTWGVKRHT